ncbi:hypothetical protein PO909_014052 [Leuciscus waleckii]
MSRKVLCDRRMPIRLKSKIYKIIVRPVALYGAECWPATAKHGQLLHAMEMRMLRWSLGLTRLDHVMNIDVRKRMGIAPITEKILEARLRWYGHVTRSHENLVAKTAMRLDPLGNRPRDRPKMRWMDRIKQDMKDVQVAPEDTTDRNKWRAACQKADPARPGQTLGRNEEPHKPTVSPQPELHVSPAEPEFLLLSQSFFTSCLPSQRLFTSSLPSQRLFRSSLPSQRLFTPCPLCLCLWTRRLPRPASSPPKLTATPESSSPAKMAASTPVSLDKMAASTPVSSDKMAASTPVSSDKMATSTPVSSDKMAASTPVSAPVSSDKMATSTPVFCSPL